MTKKLEVRPLNRVEGDLKLWLEFEDNMVTNAKSAGTMYRGFENIMQGRAPLDGLVITPRICGICSTAHLAAAAKALDMVAGVEVPDNGVRVRNITMLAEGIQNDVRQCFLLFMTDATSPAYRNSPHFKEAVTRYTPLKGDTVLQVIAETKKVLEIIAILGGQWPHSSFMVPGGVVSIASDHEVAQCRYILGRFKRWYEKRILGCSLERFSKISSRKELFEWLQEGETHRNSDLGFFLRFGVQHGFEKMGVGHGNFISYGFCDMPKETRVQPLRPGEHLFPAGFARKTKAEEFFQDKVTEDLSHSWLTGHDNPAHPYDGITRPYATGLESNKYTWAKAPRYRDLPAETGPLAQMVLGGHPLFTDLVEQKGPSVFSRVLARMVRPVLTLPALDTWLEEIARTEKIFFNNYPKLRLGKGHGLVEAPRGALGHWVVVEESRFIRYQVITPTVWNASPKDEKGVRGPWEEALVGTKVRKPDYPVEVDHVVRSFDPCLVCTVHTTDLTRE